MRFVPANYVRILGDTITYLNHDEKIGSFSFSNHQVNIKDVIITYQDGNIPEVIEVQSDILTITEFYNSKNKNDGYKSSTYTRISEDDWPYHE